MGELHLEIIVDRMKREFKVEANVGEPQVFIQFLASFVIFAGVKVFFFPLACGYERLRIVRRSLLLQRWNIPTRNNPAAQDSLLK